MKMTLTPPAFSSATILSRRLVSVNVRLEVGSSMITISAPSESALAISTSWRWASERSETGVSGLKSAPSRSSRGRVRDWMAAVSIS